jgi:LacI family transcriptional regulator, galactose operon repressor
LVIESSRAYGRGCLLGIASYVRAHMNWQLLHLERGVTETLPASIKRWHGDGIIARIETDEVAKAVESLHLPTVDLRGIYRLPGGAVFDTDPSAAALLAADHLLERGYRNLAYCGFRDVVFSDKRGEALAKYLTERSISVSNFDLSPHSKRPVGGSLAQERYGEMHVEQLVPWLRELPKPVGIMACNDVRGRQIVAACELAGLKVPEEVAVIGVDNDEVICELSNPPLSSVVPDTFRIGYEGASMLDRIMSAGEVPPEETILIPPKGVQTRLSSDFLAIPDQELVSALTYIRQNACEGINVDDVINYCQISRSTLERRFIKYLGFGPKEQIQRTRLDRVKTLLRETDYDLFQIARLTGFRTTAHLVSAFKNRLGLTPGHYRLNARK